MSIWQAQFDYSEYKDVVLIYRKLELFSGFLGAGNNTGAMKIVKILLQTQR